MKIQKLLLVLCVSLCSLTMFAKQSKASKSAATKDADRSQFYQSLGSHPAETTTTENKLDAIETESETADHNHSAIASDTALNKMISFRSKVTLSTTHDFTLDTTDSLTVVAPAGDDAIIEVLGTLSRINTSNPDDPTNFHNLTLKTSATTSAKNEIDANVLIDQADLEVNANLVIKGNLYVHGGSVRVGAGATLTVQGNIEFDGHGTHTSAPSKGVDIAGTLLVNGPNDNFIKHHALTAANSFGSTSAVHVRSTGTLHTAGPLTIVNNSSTVGDAVRIESNQSLTSDNRVLVDNNVSTFSGGHGVNVIGTLASFSNDVDLQDNLGADAGSGVRVEGTVRAHRHVVLNRNARAGAGAGHGVSVVSTGLVEAHHDIMVQNNTPGTDQINVAGRVDANRNITFDQPVDVAAVIGKTGTVHGHVIVNGDLLLNESLTLDEGSSLTVNGGFATDGGTRTLTVLGDFVLNGQGAAFPTNLVSVASSDAVNAYYVKISNYQPAAGMPVTVAGTVTATQGIVHINNNTAVATATNGVTITGVVTGKGDVNVSHNTGTAIGNGLEVSGPLGQLKSTSGSVITSNNSSTGDGHGVLLASTAATGVVNAHKDHIAANNSSAGAGHGVYVLEAAAVAVGGDMSTQGNTSATGDKVNIAGTVRVVRTKVFNEDVFVSTDFAKTGTVHAHVVVNGDLVVDESLTIEGSLTVLGAVTINSGIVLTVLDDIIFDGQQRDKNVRLVGAGSIVAKNVTIKNYKPSTSGTAAVHLEAGSSIKADCDVTLVNNVGADGTAAAGSAGVLVESGISDAIFAKGGSITMNKNKGGDGAANTGGVGFSGGSAVSVTGDLQACKDLVFVDNVAAMTGTSGGTAVGGAGADALKFEGNLIGSDIIFKNNVAAPGGAGVGTDQAGGAGGSAVNFAGTTKTVHAKANMVMYRNDGKSGGDATGTATGGAGGHGVTVGSGVIVTVDSGFTVRNNNGEDGGNTGSGTNGSGGSGLNIEGAVYANDRMVLGNNGGGAVGTGGTGGTAGVDLNVSGTLETPDNTIVFDQDVTVSTDLRNTGTVNGHVIVNGDLVVDADLTINGDLSVKGSVTVNTDGTTGDFTLDVKGNVLFDGQGVAGKRVLIDAADLATDRFGIVKAGGSVTIQNYTIETPTSNFPVEVLGKINACGDVSFVNNTTNHTTIDAVSIGSIAEITSDGSVTFLKNTSTHGTPGVGVDNAGTITACKDINFIKNAGTPGVRNTGTLSAVTGSIVFKGNTGGSTLGGTVSSKSGATFTEDVTFASSITIVGDLTVCGGSVTVSAAVALTVTGDILFDGLGLNKAVNIDGPVVSNKVLIRNYKATSGASAVTLDMTTPGSIVAKGDVVFCGNETTVSGSQGVNLNGPVTTNTDVHFINNKSTNGSGSGAGVRVNAQVSANHAIFKGNVGDTAGTGKDVNVAASGTLLAVSGIIHHEDVDTATDLVAAGLVDPYVIRGNLTITSGSPLTFDRDVTVIDGDLTVNENMTVNGSLVVRGGSVTVATTKTLTVNGNILFDGQFADKAVSLVGSGAIVADNVVIQNYASSAPDGLNMAATSKLTASGNVLIQNITTTAGDGVDIAGTITVAGDLTFRDNGGMTGQDVSVAATGVLDVLGRIILDKPAGTVIVGTTGTNDFVQASGGVIRGDVVVNGDFTLSDDLTIVGDLTVLGGVTLNGGYTLDVAGDILFDGQKQNKTVDIQSNINVCNMTIQNYHTTAGTTTAVTITDDGTNAATIAASGDILIKNNQGTTNGVTIIKGTADLTITALCGAIVFKKNESTSIGDGVELAGAITSFEARDIVFADNRGMGGTSTEHGVAIGAAMDSLLARERLFFTNNAHASEDNTDSGVDCDGDITAGTLHLNIGASNQDASFGGTETSAYSTGGALTVTNGNVFTNTVTGLSGGPEA